MIVSSPAAVRTVAVIPARGGSKGVPGKNLRRVGGVPLVARAVRTCRAAGRVDLVVVSTDDPDIADVARAEGATVVQRPAALAGDEASSESALLHALDVLSEQGADPDVLVFVQCTSPFLDPERLDEAVALVADNHADAVFAAVATYEFLWAAVGAADGTVLVDGVNHAAEHRPRRQDRAADYRETGGFYAMDVAGFRQARHRFFGRTTPVVVPEATAVDVDTLEDLVLAQALAAAGLPGTATGAAGLDVDVVFTDFDGVHTDDTAWLSAEGVESVRVSRSDGFGVERLRRAGVPLVVVSKETNPVVTARARKLGVEVAQGVEDKAALIRAWLARAGIPPERAAYLGNDLNDLAPMEQLGWPVAVADARPEVQRAARLVLAASGGQGAVRELCDRVLAARRHPVKSRPARPLRLVTADGAAARGGAMVRAATAGADAATGPAATLDA